MKTNTRIITGLSLLAAMSVILIYIPFLRFPIFPAAPFLEYDAADIPIMIGGFLFGPFWGLILSIIVAFIQGVTVSAASGIYGIIMHLIATGSFVVIAGLIYKKMRNLKGAIIGMLSGILFATLLMVGANLIITPLFLGTSVKVIKGMLLPIIIPFNLIKFSINGVVCFLLYKRIHKAFDYIMKEFNKPFKDIFQKKKAESKTTSLDATHTHTDGSEHAKIEENNTDMPNTSSTSD